MYRHIKEYELRYTDVDAYDNLKLSSLLSFLEESACLSADELGFGYKDVTPKGFGFIIVNNYIKLFRNIRLGEKVSIHTWPIKPRFMFFFRDSEIYVGNEKVGVATSRWVMVDLNSFVSVSPYLYFKSSDFDSYNTERSIEFSDWKIPAISGGEKSVSKKIRYSDYDHYLHMNNTKYVDGLMDCFSVEELKDKRLSSVQISYVKQCKENEIIDYIRENTEKGYIVEGLVDGELRVRMRILFDEI